MKVSLSDVRKALHSFDVGVIRSVRKIPQGLISSNWDVRTSTGRYVARLAHPHRKPRDVLSEQRFARVLRQHIPDCGFPQALRTRNGRWFIRLGKQLFWVYPWLPGVPAKRMSEHRVRQVAALMARMHIVAQDVRIARPGWEVASDTAWLLRKIRAQKASVQGKKRKTVLDRAYLRMVDEVIAAVHGLDWRGYSRLPKVAVHSDLWGPNLLFARGKLVGVLDFDIMSVDAAVRDLASFLKDSCYTTNRQAPLNFRKARAAIQAYTKIRPIRSGHLSYAPQIMVVNGAIAFFYNYYLMTQEPERKVPSAWIYWNYATVIYYSSHVQAIARRLEAYR